MSFEDIPEQIRELNQYFDDFGETLNHKSLQVVRLTNIELVIEMYVREVTPETEDFVEEC